MADQDPPKKKHFVQVSYEWLGLGGSIMTAVTVLLILLSMYWLDETGVSYANYAMSAALLVGSFAFMAIWYHREKVDGCSMGMGECVRKILREQLKPELLQPAPASS